MFDTIFYRYPHPLPHVSLPQIQEQIVTFPKTNRAALAIFFGILVYTDDLPKLNIPISKAFMHAIIDSAEYYSYCVQHLFLNKETIDKFVEIIDSIPPACQLGVFKLYFVLIEFCGIALSPDDFWGNLTGAEYQANQIAILIRDVSRQEGRVDPPTKEFDDAVRKARREETKRMGTALFAAKNFHGQHVFNAHVCAVTSQFFNAEEKGYDPDLEQEVDFKDGLRV